MAVAQKAGLAGFWGNYLARRYTYFTIGFILFSMFVGLLESFGVISNQGIGYLFLLLTLAMYAGIGIMSRTKHLDEYYVAGRSVPAIANGMATGADWMSAASFISMAGTLWLLGYDGLAYIMGWTGGYVLLALLFAPYIRKFGQYTIPDFVGARYEGNRARIVASIAAILVSLTYVTAQVVGVGLIMSRLVGVSYEVGVVVGLMGVLVCSFLGGMKAVTWTQVAQYIILITAYLIPVTMLSLKLTGVPIPQLMYGRAISEINRLETEQLGAPTYTVPFRDVPSNASLRTSLGELNTKYNLGLTIPAATSDASHKGQPWNFLALMFCLMVGTAGLPHILIRFYTVPSVKESRKSVGYSLLFIFLLYFTAPAYAAFSRWEMLANVAGKPVSEIPSWAANWTKTGLLNITDMTKLEGVDGAKPPAWAATLIANKSLVWTDANGDGKIQLGDFVAADPNDATKGGTAGELSGTAVTAKKVDGILQFPELAIGADLVVLATPEIAGLPYTIAALVAAGGLAAALSTADGLLVVIASAIAHDVYAKALRPDAPVANRVRLGKIMILVGAAAAALLALPRLALIAQMVAWAFSLAAASFFPIILLGIFWKRANGAGAIAGMIGGLVVTIFYMYMNYTNPHFNVLGISHLGSGLFGLITNFILTIGVSLATAPPSNEIQRLVESLRLPTSDDSMRSSGPSPVH
ncbi:Na+/solute symporter [Oscillochloris trichoides DG-6]|uniref:Na+/solute symporter n=1 Tax=Oscillochloris trichoides DG-6 TaxID=765420 RepID=E1IG20_9CHLR|nr:sodium:solute symporter family protein [Oscillochloris trichoides]EFO79857.1 Na+/solute symporter [Oscillochloris trichoides DG-6]